MFKKRHLVTLGCCLSFTAAASTIEFTRDEQWEPAKHALLAKDWRPSQQTYPGKQTYSSHQTYSAKSIHQPVKSSAPNSRPLEHTAPKKIQKEAPFVKEMRHWSATGSVGYTQYQNAGDSSGGAFLGRFAIGRDLYTSATTRAGFEIGVQNGNRMSIEASQETLDLMGSLPIWTTVKPMMDLLATVQMAPMESSPAFLVLKGGMAYRQWEMERQSINNLSQMAGEIQVGVGVAVVERATLSLVYQGVYGANPDFTVNPDSSAQVKNIPVQNGVLLSLGIML